MVSFTLQQATSIVNTNQYQVINSVIAAVGSDPNIYVYNASTQRFSHYASAADMTQWPTSPDVANMLKVAFYRLSSVTRTWDTVGDMNEDVALSLFRAQSLANELTEQQGSLVGTTVTTVTGS
jgi:hypothetical protein